VTLAHHVPPAREEVDLDSLHLACEVHDVGKLGVAAAILNKKGPLSAEEFLEVKKHPRTARRILEPLVNDDLVLAVAGWHHERWDGKGYPDGLSGEGIPLAARIVAIANVLDAMTSSRAYRPERSWDETIELIQSEGGGQFDPDLMDPFRTALPALERLFRASKVRASKD
jgi:putative two-component system response regulator